MAAFNILKLVFRKVYRSMNHRWTSEAKLLGPAPSPVTVLGSRACGTLQLLKVMWSLEGTFGLQQSPESGDLIRVDVTHPATFLRPSHDGKEVGVSTKVEEMGQVLAWPTTPIIGEPKANLWPLIRSTWASDEESAWANFVLWLVFWKVRERQLG